MEWWTSLNSEQQFTAIVAVVAALLGASASLCASLLVFSMTRRNEIAVFETRLKAIRDTNARVGLAKLTEISNYLHSVNNNISRQFTDAFHDGVVVFEPALAIVPLISSDDRVDNLTAAEMEFLFFSNSGSLVSRIQLLQRRVSTHMASLSEYNRLRHKLDEYMFEHGEMLASAEAGEVSIKMDEQFGLKAEAQVGSLNRILAKLIDGLEKDLEESLSVLDEYRTVAENVFGEKFPKIRRVESE